MSKGSKVRRVISLWWILRVSLTIKHNHISQYRNYVCNKINNRMSFLPLFKKITMLNVKCYITFMRQSVESVLKVYVSGKQIY